ncbi:MAG: nucleotidyltransferase family protein, partial [Armatimonadota bacterium]
MPVRSLHSSVLRWPDREIVLDALRRWTDRLARGHANVRRLGYCGSYARGDWGVGSDLDIIVVIAAS